MHVRNWLIALVAMGSAFGAVAPARASTVTYDVTFDASDFVNPSPRFAVPIGSVTGHFHVTLTPGQSASGTSGVSLDSIDAFVLRGSTPLFSYDAAADQLIFETGVPDFPDFGPFHFIGSQLVITAFTSAPTFGGYVYVAAIGGSTLPYLAQVGHVSVTSVAATPLPAALPLFVSALGGLGFVGWRRRV